MCNELNKLCLGSRHLDEHTHMPRLEPVTIAVRFDIFNSISVSRVLVGTERYSLRAYEGVRLPLFGPTEGHDEAPT
jgi:hypothetical protein